jgi:hypothetical protein
MQDVNDAFHYDLTGSERLDYWEAANRSQADHIQAIRDGS